MGCIEDESIDLIVTSPPYPMIEMWDDIMTSQNPKIGSALSDNPSDAFEMMHQELYKAWRECYRLLKDGGMMCINIGDATRTINKEFQLYNNHTRIVNACISLGFSPTSTLKTFSLNFQSVFAPLSFQLVEYQ